MELIVILIAAAVLFLIVKSRRRRIETEYANRERAAPIIDKTYMTDVPVVGTVHRGGEAETFAKYAEDNHAAIHLVAEPDNLYDEYAVKVIGIIPAHGLIRSERRLHVGYLPRRVAYRIGMNRDLPRLRATLTFASTEPPEDFDGPEILIDIDRI